MGFIADDIRLPPDPKVDKGHKALIPDLTELEMAQLRDIIQGILILTRDNISYGRVIFGSNNASNKSQGEVRVGLAERNSLFEKILKR